MKNIFKPIILLFCMLLELQGKVPGRKAELCPTPLPTSVATITPTLSSEFVPSLPLDITAATGDDGSDLAQYDESTAASCFVVPQTGTWQLKNTTDKKYIILGTDDDNIGNPKFFRLLRTYDFPYTMNVEAENVNIMKELGPDTDDAVFTSEDASPLFPNGVDIVTLGRYLYENDLGEVAQHGSSGNTLWDSEKLAGDFLTSLHTDYVKKGGTKTEEELRQAIMEQLSNTDGAQGASYVSVSRACLEEAYGFPIYTVGIWGGVPIAIVDGIECNLNPIKGTGNYDWRANNYTSVGAILGTWKGNRSTYDISRVTCGVDEVADYIEKIEPGKACEFFWHMPFQDEPDITKWRVLFEYIKSLVDSGKAEVVTRSQYAELGEWVENPITTISIDRENILLGEVDSDCAYTVTATYADGSTANVTGEAILDRSAINTAASGIYLVSASYRGFHSSVMVSVIDASYTIPEGLKDNSYWFVAKNETQNVLIAGNTTGTFGRAGASGNKLVFLDCSNGKFNGWISFDNGATWTQVNTNNQHYRNVKTSTLEGVSGFNFGCGTGDIFTWIETSDNFVICY